MYDSLKKISPRGYLKLAIFVLILLIIATFTLSYRSQKLSTERSVETETNTYDESGEIIDGRIVYDVPSTAEQKYDSYAVYLFESGAAVGRRMIYVFSDSDDANTFYEIYRNDSVMSQMELYDNIVFVDFDISAEDEDSSSHEVRANCESLGYIELDNHTMFDYLPKRR